nr:pectinesterase, catalytic [Ipomoea batatas]
MATATTTSFKLDLTCSSGGDDWNFLMIYGSFWWIEIPATLSRTSPSSESETIDREDALENHEESGKPLRRNPLTASHLRKAVPGLGTMESRALHVCLELFSDALADIRRVFDGLENSPAKRYADLQTYIIKNSFK